MVKVTLMLTLKHTIVATKRMGVEMMTSLRESADRPSKVEKKKCFHGLAV